VVFLSGAALLVIAAVGQTDSGGPAKAATGMLEFSARIIFIAARSESVR